MVQLYDDSSGNLVPERRHGKKGWALVRPASEPRIGGAWVCTQCHRPARPAWEDAIICGDCFERDYVRAERQDRDQRRAAKTVAEAK